MNLPNASSPSPTCAPALAALKAADVHRVELLLPLAFLVRVEILDTPGFNAPDEEHTRTARSAFDEADVVIWLFDATQTMKQSERAILDEAKLARLPVQMLVNKADRLLPEDLARVMNAVDEELAAAHIPSLAPPLALSARRALAGKLGDAQALEESGWNAAQALLDEGIVARSGELKDRAVRRRAARIVGRLVSQAATAAAAQRRTDDEAAARAHAIGQTAAKIERNVEGLARELATALRPSAEAWRRDLEVVYIGRDQASASADPVLARYRVERALDALGLPLARALASLAPEASLRAADLSPLARALVRAAAAASPADLTVLLDSLAHAAIATLVERLFSATVPPAPSRETAGSLRELKAFATLLLGSVPAA